ncbi:hypothetical protein ACFWNW_16930 [Streptomyces seoulensis]|uniref:hypothetical protein n=1 Tax=Streptomyces seoulensis TaxID=73044 RepID=UPI00365FCB7B
MPTGNADRVVHVHIDLGQRQRTGQLGGVLLDVRRVLGRLEAGDLRLRLTGSGLPPSGAEMSTVNPASEKTRCGAMNSSAQ